jgi:hypothetical protein
MTKTEKEVIDKLQSLRTDPNPPEEWVSLSVEKEVLYKRIRSAGPPPDYVDRQALSMTPTAAKPRRPKKGPEKVLIVPLLLERYNRFFHTPFAILFALSRLTERRGVIRLAMRFLLNEKYAT